MTGLWETVELFEVVCDEDKTPRTFILHHRHHRVETISGRWRVDEGWWDERVWREYFQVSTHRGMLLILYRDLLTNRWYLERIYD